MYTPPTGFFNIDTHDQYQRNKQGAINKNVTSVICFSAEFGGSAFILSFRLVGLAVTVLVGSWEGRELGCRLITGGRVGRRVGSAVGLSVG